MEVAGSEAERRGATEGAAPRGPHPLQLGGDVGARRQVREEREVIPRARRAPQLVGRARRNGLLATGLPLSELGTRQRLRCFDVGLVERVDAESAAQSPGAVLPPQELDTEVERVGREVGDQVDVRAEVTRRLVHDGDDAATFLPGALGDELLDPIREAADRRRRAQHQFVGPRPAAGREVLPEPHLIRGIHRRGPLEQGSPVDAHQRGREHAHDREGGIAPAHVYGMGEHAAETPLAGKGLERAAGIGDRRELPRIRARGEVVVKREGLDRGARFAADQE